MIHPKARPDCTGISPTDWRFAENSYGRPEIDAPEQYHDLRFSVTHTPGLVACVVSTSAEVGGMGLSIPLKDFSIQVGSVRDGSIRATFTQSLGPTPERWRFEVHDWRHAYCRNRRGCTGWQHTVITCHDGTALFQIVR